MKRLYNRNKDIEVYHKQKLESTNSKHLNRSNTLNITANNDGTADNLSNDENTEDVPHELDIIAEFKNREEKMTTEL